MADKKKIQCKNCKKPFTLFMAHLKKIEECQKAYGEEYQQMLATNNQKRKNYLKVRVSTVRYLQKELTGCRCMQIDEL